MGDDTPTRERPASSAGDPTLFDPTDLLAAAQWVAEAAAAGVIGAVAYDLIRNMRNRLGISRVVRLQEEVRKIVQADESLEPRQKESIDQQLDQLFEDFQ